MCRRLFDSKFVFFHLAVGLFLINLTALVPAQGDKMPAPDAANFVSLQYRATLRTEQIDARRREVFGESLPAASQSVDLYKISYRSKNLKGARVVLSGLVALPKEAPKGLVIYNHGTTTDLALSPSRYTGKLDGTEAALATLVFASGGYAVAMPDYLGLGDDKTTFHPYPLGAVNSAAAIDLIEPARVLAWRRGTAVGKNLFITGYSEGGGVALWTTKNLENRAGAFYRVTAAAPLAGPYDLSGTTRRWLIASNTDQQGFVTRLFLLSYMVQSFHKNNGVKLTDYFKPSMALTVAQAFKTHRRDEDVIKRLALAAVLMRAQNSLENVLTPRFFKALQDIDLSDPVVRELKNNDVYDWLPRTRLLLVNLEVDQVVDPGNSDAAFRAMRARGAADDILKQYVIRDANLDHLTAVAPSLLQARLFFDEAGKGN